MPSQVQQPELGIAAPTFDLPATDGRRYKLADVAGEKGTVVVFICNHCPYVKAITDRMVQVADDLRKAGIGFVAICSNDAQNYPADSFENMGKFASERDFSFPYLHDEDQAVARAFDAQCTPDFFGLDAAGVIRYRGRLDEGRTNAPAPDAKRELYDAMLQIAETGMGPDNQINSVGCGIKWMP